MIFYLETFLENLSIEKQKIYGTLKIMTNLTIRLKSIHSCPGVGKYDNGMPLSMAIV